MTIIIFAGFIIKHSTSIFMKRLIFFRIVNRASGHRGQISIDQHKQRRFSSKQASLNTGTDHSVSSQRRTFIATWQFVVRDAKQTAGVNRTVEWRTSASAAVIQIIGTAVRL